MKFWIELTHRMAKRLERSSRTGVLLIAFASVEAIWVTECLVGPEIGVSIFYILPIASVVWKIGGAWTVVMPIISAGAWLTAELAAGKVYSHWEVALWQTIIRLSFFFIFARLITMRKHYLIEKEAREHAQEVSRLKTNMIALVSHEYSNVLTNLKLSTFLLRGSEPTPLPESRSDSYNMLEKAIEHLRSTTVNFLSLNRLESGTFLLNIRRTPIDSIASEVLLLMQPLIAAKQLRLEVDFPPIPLPVKADPDALSIIMSNLITNAVKYTSAGTITVRISLEEGPLPRALFSVEDTGIGISAQDRERVLAGFRTEDSQKAARGFGIGLSLAKELIERHGSHIEIESEPGKGSRFCFHLPLWE
jgi:signal transduction histidine kinase